MVRKDLTNEAGVKETRIEELVAVMKRQELANSIQLYSDKMVDTYGAESFDEFVNSDDGLTHKMINPDLVRSAIHIDVLKDMEVSQEDRDIIRNNVIDATIRQITKND